MDIEEQLSPTVFYRVIRSNGVSRDVAREKTKLIYSFFGRLFGGPEKVYSELVNEGILSKPVIKFDDMVAFDFGYSDSPDHLNCF
jgi:hypothetical protein